MNKSAKSILAVMIGTVFLLSGCSTFQSALDVLGDSDAMSDSLTAGIPTAEELQFSLVYASVLLAGGYGIGGEDFEDGVGVRWKIDGNPYEDEMIVTRARLRSLDDGSAWWSIETSVDGDPLYYETLLRDYSVEMVRYQDKGSGEIREFVPEGFDDMESSADESEAARQDLDDAFVGRETVTVPAGTYAADRYEFLDDSGQYRTTVWVSDDVPGGTIRYESEDLDDETLFEGELLAVESGFRTELNSY